jgi:hypothetical protein
LSLGSRQKTADLKWMLAGIFQIYFALNFSRNKIL